MDVSPLAWAGIGGPPTLIAIVLGARRLIRRAGINGRADDISAPVLRICAQTLLKLAAVLAISPLLDRAKRRWPDQADTWAELKHDFLRRLGLQPRSPGRRGDDGEQPAGSPEPLVEQRRPPASRKERSSAR